MVVLQLRKRSGPAAAAFKAVATPLVTLHVASDTEGLSAPGVWALEGLLASVRVAVNPQGAGTRKGLVASLADVAILRLGEGCGGGRSNVVVMLPRVSTRSRSQSD